MLSWGAPRAWPWLNAFWDVLAEEEEMEEESDTAAVGGSRSACPLGHLCCTMSCLQPTLLPSRTQGGELAVGGPASLQEHPEHGLGGELSYGDAGGEQISGSSRYAFVPASTSRAWVSSAKGWLGSSSGRCFPQNRGVGA